MTFKPIKPYQPWYNDERDYNTNAPSYYDYLANTVNLEKVQTDAINELLVRDVNFQDSDEVHVDKLANWHSDDDTNHGEITFKAHVITSPSSTTQTINGTDYVASNGLSVLHDGLYAPDYKKVLDKFSSDNNSKFTKITSDVNTLNAGVNTLTAGVSSLNNELNTVKKSVAAKQNALTATDGIKLTNNTLSLDSLNEYNGDLNKLKTTQIVKTAHGATNMPAYSGTVPYGILNVTRLGNVVSQVYYPGNNNAMFVRSCENVGTSTEKWNVWRTFVDTDGLDSAIKNVNKSYNLQNPNIYGQHRFSQIGSNTSGNWGFYFFNDTNSKLYNVKLACGTIINATKGTVLAQQNVSSLLEQGVPVDFLNKAKNSYIFRSGYYLGNSLKRVALKLKTKEDFSVIEITLDDFDGYSESNQFVTNTDIVAGHEVVPAAVTYNNAVSIEETSEEKAVVDTAEE